MFIKCHFFLWKIAEFKQILHNSIISSKTICIIES